MNPSGSRPTSPVHRNLGPLVLLAVIVLSSCASSPTAMLAAATTSATSRPPSPSAPGSVAVSTSAELIAALSATSPHDIVISRGHYDAPTPFVNNNGHRIRAAEPGTAVFGAGLVIGGSSTAGDALIQGVVFDLSDRQKTLQGAAINVWGGATGARIIDVTVEGHGTLGSALMARQPEGLVVQRLQARGFTDYGVFVDANSPDGRATRPALIEDIVVTDVSRAEPRSSDGTAEACLWVGHSATVRRALLRACAWMGVWAGTASNGSVLEDLTIDDTPVGVYIEHFTTGSLFQRLRIGPRVHTGIACEWADPAWERRPACVDDLIQDSTIDSCAIGVNMGSGTTRTTVRRVLFIGQRVAAVIDPAGVDDSFGGNNYLAIGAGAIPVATGAQATAAALAGAAMTCPPWAVQRTVAVSTANRRWATNHVRT